MTAAAEQSRGIAAVLRAQAAGCAPGEGGGSPLYTALLTAAADDWEAGGPTRDVLAGHEHDPGGSALGLRLMAALHRLVLERRAPALALHYPSVGGTAPAQDAWPAARAVLHDLAADVRTLVDLPCQTNEVARSAVLLTGLLAVAGGRPVRLLEVGASAGLNLRVDAYRYVCATGAFGPLDSPLVLTDPWTGPAPDLGAPLHITERRGCDIAPVDPATPEGRLRLTSQVWADQPWRFERLRAALDVAARVPAAVDAQGAAGWLTDRLAAPSEGVVTVVWHSVVWQYLHPDERAACERLLTGAGGRATTAAPLVHLSMEPERRDAGWVFPLRATTWPGGTTRHLADAGGHGPPVRLTEAR